MNNLESGLMFISGIGILFFSYLIGIKKKLYLITNHNKSLKNKDNICNNIGISLGIIGISNLFTPYITSYLGNNFIYAYSLVIIICIFYIIKIYIKEL